MPLPIPPRPPDDELAPGVPREAPVRRVRARFGRAQRLTKANEFDAVHKARTRKIIGPLSVSAAPNGLSHARLGLSIGRRLGPAVVRVRLKRLVREAFRLEQDHMPPGLDLVVSVRTPEGAALAPYREALKEAAHELRLEWERRQRRAAGRAPRDADHGR